VCVRERVCVSLCARVCVCVYGCVHLRAREPVHVCAGGGGLLRIAHRGALLSEREPRRQKHVNGKQGRQKETRHEDISSNKLGGVRSIHLLVFCDASGRPEMSKKSRYTVTWWSVHRY